MMDTCTSTRVRENWKELRAINHGMGIWHGWISELGEIMDSHATNSQSRKKLRFGDESIMEICDYDAFL